MRSFPDDRRAIRNCIILGAIVCAVTLCLGYVLLPAPMPRLETVSLRIMYCLRWQIWSVLTLVAGIGKVASVRFFTKALDPIEGGGEHLVEVDKRYIQNTLEQLMLHIFSLVALSSFLTPESMHVIPILVCLFVVGRITFWYGYLKSAVKRAFGFQMTFYPSVMSLVYCVFCFLRSGPTFALSET